MKKNDFVSIGLITITVSLITYFVANFYFSNSTSQKVKIKTVQAIKSDIPKPDPAIFNKDAVNPSVQVNITKTDTTQ